MAVFYDIPVSDLPEHIQSKLPENVKVNITIEVADGSIPGYTDEQLDDMLGPIDLDPKDGHVLETREEINEFFEKLKTDVQSRVKQEKALLRKIG